MTKEEIELMKMFLEESFHKLKKDYDLIELPSGSQVFEAHECEEKYERKLHEICINHRLAFYLETSIYKYYSHQYCVDIEYNRYYKNQKLVSVDGENKIKRPDIIIHTRTERYEEIPQHLLIIEAKKDVLDPADILKVKSFMNDYRYRYKFGLVVNYNNFFPIRAKLYYKNDSGNIKEEELEYMLKLDL